MEVLSLAWQDAVTKGDGKLHWPTTGPSGIRATNAPVEAAEAKSGLAIQELSPRLPGRFVFWSAPALEVAICDIKFTTSLEPV